MYVFSTWEKPPLRPPAFGQESYPEAMNRWKLNMEVDGSNEFPFSIWSFVPVHVNFPGCDIIFTYKPPLREPSLYQNHIAQATILRGVLLQ